MATGDTLDIASRFRRLLPRGWFGEKAPVLDAVAQGIGAQIAPIYSMQETAYSAMRLATCRGRFLDLFAADYFGAAGLPRLPGEGDDAYRSRVKWNLTAPRGTRSGMILMLRSLTGRQPIVVNPGRPSDVGSYNFARGYNTLGAYGTMTMPFQAFVTAYRGLPALTGGGFGGYGYAPSLTNLTTTAGDTITLSQNGTPLTVKETISEPYAPGGYGTGAIAYATLNAIGGALTDAHILEQIAAWTPAHAVSWVRLKD